jgi:hypothetical protein
MANYRSSNNNNNNNNNNHVKVIAFLWLIKLKVIKIRLEDLGVDGKVTQHGF